MTDHAAPAGAGAAGPDATTRRELMLGTGAAGAAAAMAAVAPAFLAPREALAAPVGDAAVLVSALRVEQVIVYGYERALASGVIAASAEQVLKLFLGQEDEHVHALSLTVQQLGGVVPAAPSDLATFEVALHELHVKRSPAGLRSERNYLNFLVKLETVVARAYRLAIDTLVDVTLIQTAAQIMANEAQHATFLRELMNPGDVKIAVPTGFVAGSS